MNNTDEEKIRKLSVVFAVIIYGILIGVNFDPNVTEVQAKVAGNTPLGIPVRVFFIILNAVLFLPIFFVSKHFVKIASYALKQGKSVRTFALIRYLFSIGEGQPLQIQKSKNIVLFSLLYFIVVFVIWIILTSAKGV